MAIIRNAKKRDFNYYLTNLDWDDGSPIERDEKLFTRNYVFEHNYDKPGFYSIKGLVFKFERVMINASPPENLDMSLDYELATEEYTDSNHPAFGETKLFVRSKKTITQLSSSLSETIKSIQIPTRWRIEESYRGANPVRIGTSQYISDNNLPPSWVNTVVTPIEKRDEGRLPGIEIPIRLKQDISGIDRIYYSFEINLANPNGEDNPSQYIFLEESYPIKIDSFDEDDEPMSTSADTETKFRSLRFLMGVGGNSTGADRDDDVKNGGWQRITGNIFVQEPENYIDSNGNDTSGLKNQIHSSKITVYPRYPEHTPQDENVTAFIGIRNLVIKTPNTENIIRPVEWQRFYSNIIVNPRDDYQSPLYELNDFAMIGGVSEKSSHFKTLTALASFDSDDKEYRNNSLISSYNPYDFIAIYDTMAKYNADYYNEVLDPYTNPIHEDYAPYWRDDNGEIKSLFDKKKIHNGVVDRDYHGVLKDTEITDVDISTTKVYKGPISIYKHLGLTGYALGNPSEPDYWKNIIPKDYKLTDRSGFSQEPLEDPTKGSLTPRIPRLVWVIDEEDDQTWNGGYYWPQLPKMTRGGVFSEPIDLEQYGGKNDLITSDKISDYYEVYSGAGESLFHLTFDADDVEELQDTTNNYNLEYRVDGILDLNENDRVDILTNDISDTLENDINKQAF